MMCVITTQEKQFFKMMLNRRKIGFYRYSKATNGRVKDQVGTFIRRMREKLELYEKTGNTELLIDVGVYAWLEWMYSQHPKKHFNCLDQGSYTPTVVEHFHRLGD